MAQVMEFALLVFAANVARVALRGLVGAATASHGFPDKQLADAHAKHGQREQGECQ